MNRRGAAVAVIVAAVVIVPTGSVAHPVDPGIRTVIDEVVPAPEGVVVQVAVSVAPQLVAENTTDEPLEVLGRDGEPFLRIGPDDVEADTSHPDWWASNQPLGDAGGPPTEGSASWVRVSATPSWGWFDHRLHPSDVRGAEVEPGRELARWTVPMRLGDTDITVLGHLEGRRVLGAFRSALAEGTSAEPFDGVVAQVLDGRQPGVLVRNSGDDAVAIAGADGEPMARVGQDRTVVNRRSPTWQFSAQAQGLDLGGIVADPDAEPDWAQAPTTGSLAWLDPRGRWSDEEPPADVLGSDDPVVLLEWEVPLTVEGETVAVEAVTTWVPGPRNREAPASSPWIVVGVAAGMLVAAMVFLAVRRRRKGVDPV